MQTAVLASRSATRPPASRCTRFPMTKYVTTWPVANPWIRRERTPSRESLRDGFRASWATMATWWDCLWRWSTGCCGTRDERRKGELGLFFFFLLLVVGFHG